MYLHFPTLRCVFYINFPCRRSSRRTLGANTPRKHTHLHAHRVNMMAMMLGNFDFSNCRRLVVARPLDAQKHEWGKKIIFHSAKPPPPAPLAIPRQRRERLRYKKNRESEIFPREGATNFSCEFYRLKEYWLNNGYS